MSQSSAYLDAYLDGTVSNWRRSVATSGDVLSKDQIPFLQTSTERMVLFNGPEKQLFQHSVHAVGSIFHSKK